MPAPLMIALGLVFALMVAARQPSSSTESQMTIEPPAHAEYERHKQAAIRTNELAGQVHSQADANALVSEIAAVFAKELPAAWSAAVVRERVARAEYEAVRNRASLVSEQRLVEVWNQYVREIGAPDEAVVTIAEIHNLRDAGFTVAQLMWARGDRTVWTAPNVYALGPDGRVADGCRAIEAVRVIYDLDDLFQNLRGARNRVRRAIVPSDVVKKRVADPSLHSQSTVRFEAHVDTNPIRPAEQRYLQEHGAEAYGQLLARLFDELFPPE